MPRIKATFTNKNNGQKTNVYLRTPMVVGGMWTISEGARRAAFKRIGADWDDHNPGVVSTATARAVDSSGWNTFTIYNEV